MTKPIYHITANVAIGVDTRTDYGRLKFRKLKFEWMLNIGLGSFGRFHAGKAMQGLICYNGINGNINETKRRPVDRYRKADLQRYREAQEGF